MDKEAFSELLVKKAPERKSVDKDKNRVVI
jgi:hypothetical protein